MRIGSWVTGAMATMMTISVGAFQMPKAPSASASAAKMIDQAIGAMGGEARLRSIQSLTLDVVGHDWALEQSERPEGPWLSTYLQRTEVRDYAKGRDWFELQQRNWTSPKWSVAIATVVSDNVVARTNGQRWAAGQASDLVSWNEVKALAPERLLLTAKAATDLKVLPDETRQRVGQNVLAFSREGQRLKLFLNQWTHLPTMLEIAKNDKYGIWGDVVERRSYTFWTLEAGGLMYPRQTTTEWNDLPYADETVESIAVDAVVDEAKFAIPDDVKTTFAQVAARPSGMSSLTLDGSKAVEIAKGIVQFPAGYNVSVIDQPDGLIMIEATTSEAFTQQALAAARQRFPGKAIKAIVTTSNAWPHVGGIREIVAKGIPIYALDLNVSILTRIIKAPHTFAPDDLSKTPKTPVFHPVTARTTIGTGDTRIELIPVRGETGERMMLVWFPAAKVLYSSDLLQRDRTGKSFFMIEMPAEVVAAVEREKLGAIDKVFGMHLPMTPWSDVTAAVAAARK